MFFAGQVPTADELNDAAEVGEQVLEVTANTNSSTWNSATKVLTNLTGSFTARSGGRYKIETTASIQAGATVVTTGLLVVYKAGGAAVATDTAAGAQPLRISEATAVVGHYVQGTFFAGTSGTYGVAAVGWNPTGDASVCKLFGDSAFAINRLTVTRVA